jgi:prephenate dehydrogenase
MNKISRVDNICIVGLGLMGGSYAKRLSFKGFSINAIDINQENLKFAERQKWVKNVSTTTELVRDADFVIFALYPKTFINWLEEHGDELKPGCVITDVTGVKRLIVERAEALLRPDVSFVASHPMAGRELMGIEYADPTVFNDANFIITPTEKTNLIAIEKVKHLANILEFKNVSILTIEKHDEMVAFLSQLTHVIAINLMNCQTQDNLEDYTGDSFRDLTRIAKINEKMWTELFLVNKDYLLKEMNLFEKSFDLFRQALINDDVEKLENLMVKSTVSRKKFDK